MLFVIHLLLFQVPNLLRHSNMVVEKKGEHSVYKDSNLDYKGVNPNLVLK